MPGLFVAFDASTVDRIIESESDHARFVAGVVVWQAGELAAEIVTQVYPFQRRITTATETIFERLRMEALSARSAHRRCHR